VVLPGRRRRPAAIARGTPICGARRATARGVAEHRLELASFPGGAKDRAAYRGRLVGRADAGALWLVEEIPSGDHCPDARAILVSLPRSAARPACCSSTSARSRGASSTRIRSNWQHEDDALLTAPRAASAASIVGHVPGTTGSRGDGFVYFTDDNAIVRLALDALE